MKKLYFLSLLFLLVSCEDPVLDGDIDTLSTEIVYSESENLITITLKGYLNSWYENPTIYISLKDNSTLLEQDKYDFLFDSNAYEYSFDASNKEYFSTIAISEYNLINRNIKIQLHSSGNYSIIYLVSAKNQKTRKTDFYTKKFDI